MINFRFPFFLKQSSDEEFIEKTRKSLRIKRKWRYITAIIGILMMFMVSFGFPLMLRRSLEAFFPQNVSNEIFVNTFILSGIFGASMGLAIIHALHTIMYPFTEQRKDKMLIEYWDKLKREDS